MGPQYLLDLEMINIKLLGALTFIIAIFLGSCNPQKNTSQNKHPQEPLKPYPYYSEDVEFTNSKTGDVLAGTLTLPGKKRWLPGSCADNGHGPAKQR